MYTLILVSLSLFYVIRNAFYFQASYFRYFSFMLLAFVVIFISAMSLFDSFEDLNERYFLSYSNDSYRYHEEVGLIKENLFSTNELEGTIGDGYSVTPKMGLSSVLSVAGFWINDASIDTNYILMNFCFLIFSFFSLTMYFNIVKLFGVPFWVSVLGFFIIFLFPLDIYWNYRFLREPIANALLLSSFFSAVLCLLGNKMYFPYLIIFSLFLVLFRSQLVFLFLLFLFFYTWVFFGLSKISVLIFSRYGLFLFLISVLSIVQTLKASGSVSFERISAVFGFDNMFHVFQNYLFLSAGYLFFILLLLPVVFRKKGPSVPVIRFSFFRFFLSLIFVFYVLMSFDLQLRFVYPIFFMLKAYVILSWISARRRRSFGAWIHGSTPSLNSAPSTSG